MPFVNNIPLLMWNIQKRKDKFMNSLLNLPDCKMVLEVDAQNAFSVSQLIGLYVLHVTVSLPRFYSDSCLFSGLLTLIAVFLIFVFCCFVLPMW